MSQIKKKFIGDNEVGAAKVRLENNSSIKARNAADNADVNILKVNATDELIVEQNFIPVTPNTTKLGNDNKAFGEVHVVDIKDGTGGAVMSTNTRVVYDTSGNNSVDADTRLLIDSLSVNSIDYESRSITDSGATESIDYQGRLLSDSGGDYAIEWNNTSSVYIRPTSGSTARSVKFYDGTFTNGVSIKSPDSLSANYTLTLPPDDGTSGQVLQTNGTGTLTWVTPSGGGSTPGHQLFTLSAGDITNGYVTLTNAPIANSVMMFVSGLKSTFTVDYTVSGSQVTFSAHTPTLVAGDVVEIHYQY